MARLRDRLVCRWPIAEELLARIDGPWLMGAERPSAAEVRRKGEAAPAG